MIVVREIVGDDPAKLHGGLNRTVGGDRVMQRILVIGCSGAGKSTFAAMLHAHTGLPLISLDAQFWQPGWTMTPRTEWREKVADLASREAWIMDGTFDSSLDLRLPRTDTVIWFRLPRWRCLTRVVKRVVLGYGRVRPEMAADCPERADLDFMRYVWQFERHQVPAIENMLALHGSHLTPVIIRRDADARRILDSASENRAA
jgi:adenylate kinase family enzyme